MICTTYRLTEHYHYWTKNNPVNVQIIPELFVEMPVELAQDWGFAAAKGKGHQRPSYYIAKAFVTKRIKPMMIDGKKIYQIGLPINQGYRGIQEDAGRCQDHRQSAHAHGGRSQRSHTRIQRLPRESGEGVGDL